MNSKVLVWSYLIILSLGTILNLYIPKTEAIAKDSVVIPAEAIRLRILANSDHAQDQEIKRKVRDAVNEQITLWVQELTSLEKAKMVLTSKLPEVQAIAEKVVAEQGSTQSVKVEFGKVQFPTKLYGEFLYPAGEYQAILITLGEGTGANWWCVLYPPLCFLDFSNGIAVQSDGFEDKAYAAEDEDLESDTVAAEEGAAAARNKNVEKDVNSSKKKVVEEAASASKKKVVEEVGVASKKKGVEEVAVASKKKVVEEVVVASKKNAVEGTEDVQVEVVKQTKEAPVYTSEDEEPVKVKFFVVEMFESIFR
ncbi:stage II sporulation protein R [Neobacillus niacini]|uniref:stage II sporulation protein R n=1 Tax=Neobacillus niacini TaxID=86668 RepID=UPI002FFE4D0D